MSDINWSDPGDVTIPAQSAIAIAETSDGEILIVQEGRAGDDVITIHKKNLQALIEALSAYVERS